MHGYYFVQLEHNIIKKVFDTIIVVHTVNQIENPNARTIKEKDYRSFYVEEFGDYYNDLLKEGNCFISLYFKEESNSGSRRGVQVLLFCDNNFKTIIDVDSLWLADNIGTLKKIDFSEYKTIIENANNGIFEQNWRKKC